MNKVLLSGRIQRAPVFHQGRDGKKGSTTFTLAVKGSYSDYMNYPNVVCFGAVSDKMDAFEAGDQVVVDGSLQTRSYEKDGKKIYVTEVVASSVEPLDDSERPTSREPGDESEFEDTPF